MIKRSSSLTIKVNIYKELDCKELISKQRARFLRVNFKQRVGFVKIIIDLLSHLPEETTGSVFLSMFTILRMKLTNVTVSILVILTVSHVIAGSARTEKTRRRILFYYYIGLGSCRLSGDLLVEYF